MNKTRVITTTDDIAKTLSFIEVTCVASILSLVCITTVVGNALVLLSFTLDRKLRTHTNYFLLSLAVSDFLIGVFSMPMYTQYLLRGEWTLGEVLCDMWLAQDYMCSNASCLNLLMIGFDRYFSITSPLRYRAKRTGKRVALMISCVWIISFLMWPPWIYAWQYIDGRRTVPEFDCYVQFLETNFYLTIITSVLDYYLPLFVMLILYYKIWRETKRREKYLAKIEANHQCESLNLKEMPGTKVGKKSTDKFHASYSKLRQEKHGMSREASGGSLSWCTAAGGDIRPEGSDVMLDFFQCTGDNESDAPEIASDASSGVRNASEIIINNTDAEKSALEETISIYPNSSDLNTLSEHNITSSIETMQSKSSSKKQTGFRHDNKAARVLTAILLAFILTTTPYNVIVIIKNLDTTHTLVPGAVWHFFYYLFYVNSTLNPLCYALANKNFRRTYWKILTCSWSKKHPTVYSFSNNCSEKSPPSSRNAKCTTSL